MALRTCLRSRTRVLGALCGKWLYGLLFCLVLPLLLAAWALRLDGSATLFWPVPQQRAAAWVALGAGLALMAVSMWRLWRQGGGLPMNAYPTRHWVTQGIYGWLPHPIYTGFVLAVGAASVLLRSSGGLWVVTPLCALGAMALVWGYEGPATRQRLGALPTPPMRLTLLQMVQAAWLVLALWAGLYALFATLPAPSGAVALRAGWEHALPLPQEAVWVYTLGYVLAVAAPLCAAERTWLLRWRRAAWCVLVGGFGGMLLWPAQAPMLQGGYSGLSRHLLAYNRLLDADWLACPSFHTAWALLAALLLGQVFSRLRALWLALAAAVAASCLLTGSHAAVDVLAGALLACMGWWAEPLWRGAVRWTEQLSNSWACWQWRGVRIISHWLWSGLAAAVGVGLVAWLAGAHTVGWAALVVLAGLLAAGAWGYWLEGGHRLARPFGYYGFVLGSLLALGLITLWQPALGARLCAAFATAAPVAQAIGRLRCVVQGCCHGRPVFAAYGLRVRHAMSRVVALAGLADVPIHPTQLYSIAGNLCIAAILWRLWGLQVAWTLIAGLYLLLSSLLRFVEERYRGEPQTPVRYGLAVYQWLALGMGLAGIGATMLHGPVLAAAGTLTLPAVAVALAVGLLAALCMSVDWPGSSRRFSRLTVGGGPDRQARPR